MKIASSIYIRALNNSKYGFDTAKKEVMGRAINRELRWDSQTAGLMAHLDDQNRKTIA